MGAHILEHSASEKYLGDKIHEDRIAASITETIKGRMPLAIALSKSTIIICDDPRLIGFPSSLGPTNEFETKLQ